MKKIIFHIICCTWICSSVTGLCQESIDFNCTNVLNENAQSCLKHNACVDSPNIHAVNKNTSVKDENLCLIKANNMLNYYVQAEYAFYNLLKSDALRFIRRSLEVIKTAEAYTLKAHLYYEQKKTDQYKTFMKKARDLMDRTDQGKANDNRRLCSNSFYSVMKPAAKHTMSPEQSVHSEKVGK